MRHLLLIRALCTPDSYLYNQRKQLYKFCVHKSPTMTVVKCRICSTAFSGYIYLYNTHWYQNFIASCLTFMIQPRLYLYIGIPAVYCLIYSWYLYSVHYVLLTSVFCTLCTLCPTFSCLLHFLHYFHLSSAVCVSHTPDPCILFITYSWSLRSFLKVIFTMFYNKKKNTKKINKENIRIKTWKVLTFDVGVPGVKNGSLCCK